MKRYTPLLILSLLLALLGTHDYIRHYMAVCGDCEYVSVKMSDGIVAGTQNAPFAYRILTPYLLYALGGSWVAIVAFHFVGRFALYILAGLWVGSWNGAVWVAVLLVHAFMQLAHYTWYESDYALTEAVLILTGWLLIKRWYDND